jgi:hypothetical protein
LSATRDGSATSRALQATVTIEVTSWVTKLAGGDGTGSVILTEPFAAGETLGQVLHRCSARFPELDAALWDSSRQGLGEHLEVLVNDAVLGVVHDLDSKLEGGECIVLLGQFMGG